jgi:MFS family permease
VPQVAAAYPPGIKGTENRLRLLYLKEQTDSGPVLKLIDRSFDCVGHYSAMQNEESVVRGTMQNILIRDYVLCFLSFFGFLAAFNALIPTLPVYLAQSGSNEREVGVLIGTISISSLVSRFLVGRILLKHSERLVMMWGAVLFAFTFLALVLFRPFWPLFIVRLVQGVAFACLDTSAITYAVRIIPLAYRARAISYFLLAPPLASAIATSSGVFVVNGYGFAALLFACTGLSMCVLILSWRLKGQKTVRPAVISPVKNNLFFERKIFAPAMVMFLFAFSWTGITAFFPLYAIQCGIKNPGYFFSANAVMLIAARTLGGRVFDIYSKEKIISTAMIIFMVAAATLASSKTLPLFILAGLLWGMGSAFFMPGCMAYAFDYAGSSGGTAIGTFQAFMDLGMGFGPAITGIIIPLAGYRVTFLCLGFVCLVNLVYFQFYLTKKKAV